MLHLAHISRKLSLSLSLQLSTFYIYLPSLHTHTHTYTTNSALFQAADIRPIIVAREFRPIAATAAAAAAFWLTHQLETHASKINPFALHKQVCSRCIRNDCFDFIHSLLTHERATRVRCVCFDWRFSWFQFLFYTHTRCFFFFFFNEITFG